MPVLIGLSKVSWFDFEAVLDEYDWSPIYALSDPDEAAEFLINHVSSALDKKAPPKIIKFRPDKNYGFKRCCPNL